MGGLVSKTNIDRLERFHSLLAGQYWSALVDIPAEAIAAGDTLLINSLRYVDDNLHTVILRAHPRHYGEWVNVEVVAENGSKSTKDKKLNEHRFLTADFLALFEYQPDHESIRQSELKGIQDEVADLQMRLTETLKNPSDLRELAMKRIEDEEASKRGRVRRQNASGRQKCRRCRSYHGAGYGAECPFSGNFRSSGFSDGESRGTGREDCRCRS
ncbi:hypothetical protein [Citrobacter freundii]|jgi:hypothetical protein|uniref:hypothetical protein n=1 Tax=Citrobacter freundii TaxID=546 RepID=UPI002E155BCB|nr:hypothetical protein U0541_01595 [Citrobacter freundii]